MTVLPSQEILQGLRGRVPLIQSCDSRLPIDPKEQLQPASIDLRLGFKAYAVRHAALPHGKRVQDLVDDPRNCWSSFDLGLEKVNPLRADETYLIPLVESVQLQPNTHIEFSPKSSTGRCDVFVRVLSDYHSGYDETPAGYNGGLWLEVSPLSHEVGVRAGLALVQARFKRGETPRLTTDEVLAYQAAEGVIFDYSGQPLPPTALDFNRNGELSLHVDLARDVVGFEAVDSNKPILDLTKENAHEPVEFWKPIRVRNGELVLMKDKFYLLATEERIRIPPSLCAHLLPWVPSMGEVRLHYAGFFDNGFGGETGSHGVLEVRGRDVPFKIEHGKPVGAIIFERTAAVPSKLYQGNYKDYRPSLSKHFKYRFDAWTGEHWRAL